MADPDRARLWRARQDLIALATTDESIAGALIAVAAKGAERAYIARYGDGLPSLEDRLALADEEKDVSPC